MEETKSAKSRVTLLQKACGLQVALNDFIAGTGEPAGMQDVVEFAAQHMEFSDQKALASSKELSGMENRVPYCAHHATLMNPTIWSGLSEEWMQCVFARLPLAAIIRLHCLSKQWNRILNCQDFKQVCADVHPKLFALIPEFSCFGSFEVKLYDLKSNSWHVMEIDSGYWEPFYMMNASDGGLVSFACTSAKEESINLPVLVCNPLTCDVRALPLHSHNKRPPQMLQLVMDRISKCYKVLIVSTDQNRGLVAEVFHSNTGAWTTKNLSDMNFISGYRFRWYENYHEYEACDKIPCVYDCAEGHFLQIPTGRKLLRDEPSIVSDIRYALLQDRRFVLYRDKRQEIEGGGLSKPEDYITEFQFLESGAKWLKLKDHRCSNLGFPASNIYDLPSVHACKGLLLVVAESISTRHERGLGWLYDLSSGKWHALSLPMDFQACWMCELQWDAVP